MSAFRPFLLVCLFLTACAPRPQLNLVPAARDAGTIVDVFYSTTRARTAEEEFSADRSGAIRYGRISVSVPPKHTAGKIEYAPGRADPETAFVAADKQAFDGSVSFRKSLSKAFRARPHGKREAVIFVHGFNNNFAEGIYRIAQLQHDFGLGGVAVHYAWPSLAHPLGYAYDRDSALFGRDGLESLIRDVKAAGAETILLVGHSMGGQIGMEAIRQIAIRSRSDVDRLVDAVVLISPDIDVDVFRSQVARIGKLPQPFIIFVSKRDRALALSARLTGESNRLGNVRDVQRVSDLEVTVIDVSDFDKGLALGHFTVGNSPALIRILQRLPGIDAVIRGDQAGRPGLLFGTVLTVQNATEIVLSPITTLSEVAN